MDVITVERTLEYLENNKYLNATIFIDIDGKLSEF